MKAYKTVIYSFFIGGLFALIAQALVTVWTQVLTGTPMQFFIGGSTLISMGVIGCILGGFGVYQLVEKWGTFGALLPFSGFAMAVGMKMVGPWTKNNATTGKAVWQGLWLVIWFNVVAASISILFGYVCGVMNIEPALVVEKNTTALVFPLAFLVGGLLCALFQVVYLVVKSITPKCKPVWILLTAWFCGAIFAPLGVSGALANFAGQGFSVMIPVGGYNMYNVGVSFAMGEFGEGLLHLGSFLLAVAGLFFTGLATFLIYNAKFGRTNIGEVHRAKAQGLIDELDGAKAPAAAAPRAAAATEEAPAVS
ncbi:MULTISPECIES: SpoVA/SpoVAEb family sporulation membrane protein [Gordonibacter]|uniref:SpoVA/SpoVAEb family sporulation membrane protein n=1 Tax=Gordonibacter faecis TaxID=3047475 RepID=A0ABT7DPJ8_9ACTN|nr:MULTISPECIES: SpoVA/SpoVAEb family sporulation membrane protein [unclassified Gordonibacter]MDJ1650463.1 SpoVA/SpoVAEb family sporulation membrane protein [Gordonibacter sp. KGMB12511]HIW76906.1 SpoVA/SpoVAEb family sporulation membrane protein [Candidatus Gordonibacter avicola]